MKGTLEIDQGRIDEVYENFLSELGELKKGTLKTNETADSICYFTNKLDDLIKEVVESDVPSEAFKFFVFQMFITKIESPLKESGLDMNFFKPYTEDLLNFVTARNTN